MIMEMVNYVNDKRFSQRRYQEYSAYYRIDFYIKMCWQTDVLICAMMHACLDTLLQKELQEFVFQ